jgi:hypothetical protein
MIDPGFTIGAGAGATALQAFVNAGGIFVGTIAGGTTSLRNAGVTTVNTNTISGISTPGSTFDATWNTTDPAGWGFDAGGWIYRDASNNPNFAPATLAGNGGAIPAATAVATFAPAGDCGGPPGFGNCYGFEINANANLPGRPAVIDQPFGSGHAIMLGFDAWYRAWTTQDERLVLNGILYPRGAAIPPGPVAPALTGLYVQAPEAPVPAASLPGVASRPVNPSGSIGKNVVVRVPASQADDLRAAVRDAQLPGRIRSRVHFAWVGDSFEVVLEGVRVGDAEQRNGWESPFIGAIADRKIRVLLGQM